VEGMMGSGKLEEHEWKSSRADHACSRALAAVEAAEHGAMEKVENSSRWRSACKEMELL
jgi:hypothetical protein